MTRIIYNYLLYFGNGITTLILILNDDGTFVLKFFDNWFLSKKYRVDFSGTYSKTSNKYNLLITKLIVNDEETDFSSCSDKNAVLTYFVKNNNLDHLQGYENLLYRRENYRYGIFNINIQISGNQELDELFKQSYRMTTKPINELIKLKI